MSAASRDLPPIIFNSDTFDIKPGEFRTIDGPSFQADMHATLPWLLKHKPLPNDDWSKAAPLGDDLKFGIRTFKTHGTQHRSRFDLIGERARNTLDVYPSGKRAKICFSSDVHVPVIAERGDVVMSYTPMEVLSMRQGWKRAKGHVLIGGLGLGLIATKALQRKQVTKVTIVELDKNVIDLVGTSLKEKWGHRVEIINSDVYDHLISDTMSKHDIERNYRNSKRFSSIRDKPGKLNPKRWAQAETYDSILLDIWNSVSGKYDGDALFEDLSKNGGCKSLWGWGFKLYNDSRF